MNEKTAYEQIISGKLQALPVPDMADAIWARIEAQLDLDMPDTDTPPDVTPRFPTGTLMGSISALFAISLISFILLRKDNVKPSFQQPASTSTTIQKENKTFEQTNSPTKPIDGKVILPPVTTVLQPPPSDSSSIASSPLVATGNDSIQSAPPVALSTPTTLPQKRDTILPTKKGRGVTGINDEDYRVVPKKDSANN